MSRAGRTRVLETLWRGGFVPVLSSVVIDGAGQPLNLNADTLVRSLCQGQPFDDVFFLADVPGVFADLHKPETHMAEVKLADIPTLISAGVVQGGMIAKLNEMAKIVAGGVQTAWIVGLHEPAPVSSALAGVAGRRTAIRA